MTQPILIQGAASRCFCLAVLLTAALASAANGDEQTSPPQSLQVTLHSGKTYAGQVDDTSDEHLLVLRAGSERVWLTRSLAWDSIASAQIDGEELAVEELQQQVDSLKTPAPGRKMIVAAASSDLPTRQGQVADSPAELAAPPVIGSIAFDAFLTNWDGDVEADGLVVLLQSLDRGGNFVTGAGTVEIELFAPQRRRFQDASRSLGATIESLGRWTVAIDDLDFGPRGAVLKFPFGARHPEFRDDVGPAGLVHVRFTSPGSGVFEDSRDNVRTRPWAPNRDRLQLGTGSRFLPTERTGRGKTSFGP